MVNGHGVWVFVSLFVSLFVVLTAPCIFPTGSRWGKLKCMRGGKRNKKRKGMCERKEQVSLLDFNISYPDLPQTKLL